MRSDEEIQPGLAKRIEQLELRVAQLERDKRHSTAWRRRISWRQLWRHPPMWTFEQYPPRLIDLNPFKQGSLLPSAAMRIAIITPSFNQAQFIDATIESVVSQNYPNLYYHVQDGGSTDGTIENLKKRGKAISWSSAPDTGQSNAINLGFANVDCGIMAYLNSDDMLLPGTLTHVANYFARHPEIDIVYGHRIFVDRDGLEVGRAVLPPYERETLRYADYIPQETMFWRKSVWDTIGTIDENFHYAMDWDFILRAQSAGFRFARLPRFLACFRVHDAQKTAATYATGAKEMSILRQRSLGFVPTHAQINRVIAPYLLRQATYHCAYKLGLLRL
jgi:Glycosyl transferase family 2